MLSILILTILVPVPIIHLWLHGMLPFWRKHPWVFYVCAVVLWVLAFFFVRKAHTLVDLSLGLPAGLNIVGAILMIAGVILALMSVWALGYKRFFVWPVLHPSGEKVQRVASGVFATIPHPAYTGYVLILLGNILVHGLVYTVSPFMLYLVTIPIVMWLEEHELAQRTV